jgi:transposase
VHAVVGGFTPAGNTSFLVVNPDFHFVLAMDVIVCTAGVGNVLRTSVCTSPTALEAEVLWSGLEFVMMVALSSKLFNRAVKYIDDILDPTVLSFLQQRNFDHVFQYDNARCHVTRVCQDFLNQNHIHGLPWPALSPDLSPIEHLWEELGRRVRHRQNPPETLQELRDALVHEWNSIPQAFIQRLIGSMRRRCEAVVAARGGHTRY